MFIFNKNLLIIFLSFLGITAANAQVTKVPFKGKKIVISGTFEYLTIIGQADSVIGIQEENRSNRAKDFFDYNIDGETFFLNLKERKRSFMVLVPAEIEVGVTPAEIVFEPYSKDEYGFVDFRNLKGSVEMEGDGYHVLLDNIQSQASVVTYGDIIATLPRVDRGKALSLDTYTGNIIIEVPESKSLNLKSNALKGEVIIDPGDDYPS